MAIALLTPVPLVHLESGVDVCRRESRVAFGSQAWEVFRNLDLEGGPGTTVLIYASHSGVVESPRATWQATYLGYVESRGGAHPKGTRHRPSSTAGEDSERYWAGFYEVSELRAVGDDGILVRELSDRAGKAYARGFVPEGPIIVTTR